MQYVGYYNVIDTNNNREITKKVYMTGDDVDSRVQEAIDLFNADDWNCESGFVAIKFRETNENSPYEWTSLRC